MQCPPRSFLVLAALSLLVSAQRAGAQASGPTDISQMQGKTGSSHVHLTARSPLSAPAEVIKRMSLPSSTPAADYDISKEPFEVYVPKSPAENGKCGLMVLLHFKASGAPATAWPPVLEKYHIIFIGAENAGPNRAVPQRIGLMLDAVENARKAWPIEDARVYMFIGDPTPPVSAVAFDYPDVFQGALWSINWLWYAPLPDSMGRQWRAALPAPAAAPLALDKTRTRFFLAQRERPPQKGVDVDRLIEEQGFHRSGYKYAKMITVPASDIGHYVNYGADWFEQGIQFLDAPIAELANAQKAAKARTESDKTQAAAASPARSAAASQPAASGSPAPASSNPPAADDSDAKAESALSLAKSYMAVQRYDAARTRLQQIIEKYPKTPAADQARSLLKEIQDK